MRVLILHNELSEQPTTDERDVIVQRDAVATALLQLGHQPTSFGCTLDLHQLAQRLREDSPELVFNLVESLEGDDRLMALAPLILDTAGILYTGAGAEALLLTGNKPEAKSLLLRQGLPTPAWLCEGDAASSGGPSASTRWIVKPAWEHASLGMDDESVVSTSDRQDIERLIQQRQVRWNTPHFAEAFVDGREFNLSLLAHATPTAESEPQLLPVAEIDFSAFPKDRPRIVGHRAKWDDASFEYHHTPRVFEFPSSDAKLLQELRELALDCWRLFNLRGFARVDFRVDRQGRPWILEINPNPCLSPDAGFAAAIEQAGLTYAQGIARIVESARPERPASMAASLWLRARDTLPRM